MSDASAGDTSRRQPRAWQALRDLAVLTKFGITVTVALTTGGGFVLGARGSPDMVVLLHTIVATMLMAGGSCALNQFAERDLDAQMTRTRNRPLPAGRMAPHTAAALGLALVAAGASHMALAVNDAAALLGLMTFGFYLLVYTPLKRVTPLCTLVGAFPGAMPPVMGWVAATGRIDFESVILFCLLFTWQLPHSLAIAWMWRDDYRRARMPMLTALDTDGHVTARLMVFNAIALGGVSLVPAQVHMAGHIYLAGAAVAGATFFTMCVRWASGNRDARARGVFVASIAYLVVIFALLIGDKS